MPPIIRIDLDKRLPERLRRLNASLFESRFRQYMLRSELEAKRLVAGPVLKVRTGLLRSRIAALVTRSGTRLEGKLGTSGVIYAAIHELGGTIPAHRVVAKRALALAIPIGGGVIFRRSAMIPPVRIPKRSYLRPALQSQISWLKETLRQDVQAT